MRFLKAVLFLFVLAVASEASAQTINITSTWRTNNRQAIYWQGNWTLPANTQFLSIEGQWRNGANGAWQSDFYPTYPAQGVYVCDGGNYLSPGFTVQVRSRMTWMDFRSGGAVQRVTNWTAITNVP